MAINPLLAPSAPLTAANLLQAASAVHTPAPLALNISLDDAPRRRAEAPLLRRDSMKRREALLQGKEGTRRRQRWENDRLLSNPHAQPPLPSDWEVQPTYPRHATVPYYLAPLWDGEGASAGSSLRPGQGLASLASAAAAKTAGKPENKVPKELRARLKRARAARGLLMELESEVRRFVEGWARGKAAAAEAAADEGRKKREKEKKKQEREREEEERPKTPDLDSEDEEIVFIGREGGMSDSPGRVMNRLREELGKSKKKAEDDEEGEGEEEGEMAGGEGAELQLEKLVFHSPPHDNKGTFSRWLVHQIAQYYDLRTWSETVVVPGNPPVRSRGAWVGIQGGQGLEEGLPRPLWGLV